MGQKNGKNRDDENLHDESSNEMRDTSEVDDIPTDKSDVCSVDYGDKNIVTSDKDNLTSNSDTETTKGCYINYLHNHFPFYLLYHLCREIFTRVYCLLISLVVIIYFFNSV